MKETPMMTGEQCKLLLDLIDTFNRLQTDTGTATRQSLEMRMRLGLERLDLVWHREQVGGTLTFHFLITEQDQVYSIGANPKAVLPWPLRGAIPVAPDVLFTVNETEVRVRHAIACLDFLWREQPLMDALVDSALIAGQSERDPPEIATSELSAAAGRFYSERGLNTLDEQDAWLREHGLTRIRLEGLIRELLVRRKTEAKLVAQDVKIHLAERRGEYLGMRAAQVVLRGTLPECASARLQENPSVSLSELAAHLAWESGQFKPLKIEFVELLRYELAEYADGVWLSQPGSVHLVQCVGAEWRLISLLARETDIPGTALELRIVERLIHDWCSEQRKVARICWRWGPAEKA